MKDKITKDKNMKTALLCGGMVIIGVGIGMLINGTKKIPTIKNGNEVVASIDGKKFTADELYKKLKDQVGQNVLTTAIDEYITSKETNKDDEKEADEYTESYITNLKSQYESYGQNFTDALTSAGYATEDAFKELVKKDHLKQMVAEKFVKENNFSDSEVKDYYNNKIEGSMVVRYILIQPEKKDNMTDDEVKKAEKEALKEANSVISKLKKGEDFAELAKKHSDDSSTASEGGLYKGFTKDQVVEEFWNAATNLKDGKYTTEPVESSYGYFVILRVKQNKKPSLKDSKGKVLDALYKEESTNDANLTSKAWVEIRKNYNLKINDSKIQKSYDDVINGYDKKTENTNTDNQQSNK